VQQLETRGVGGGGGADRRYGKTLMMTTSQSASALSALYSGLGHCIVLNAI